uniref:Putative secreted protein n=1 Tax=Ixodes ricinus TaxID=34613 RepID=V5HNA2_IXORI
MGCGLGVIKFVLCTVNVTISLLGIAAIVVGAVVLNNPNLHDVNDHLEKFSNYPTAATVALVAGVMVLLFGFCGCCGACFGVGWLLLMFIITMICLRRRGDGSYRPRLEVRQQRRVGAHTDSDTAQVHRGQQDRIAQTFSTTCSKAFRAAVPKARSTTQ